MAGKNQVILTFAGDSKSLDQTYSKVQEGASKTEKSFDSASDSATKFNKTVGSGGREVEEYSGRLDRAGESADNAETRFTGLASGIDGVTTLMANPSPQEFAQGIADVADGAANSLVPALKATKDGLASFVDGIGGVKGLLVGGAVVGGIVALAAGVKAADDAANAKNITEFVADLLDMNFAANDVNQAMLPLLATLGHLDDLAAETAKQGGAQAVERLIELGESAQLSDEAMEMLNGVLEETGSSAERMAEEIRSVDDALHALTDPVFAVFNAQEQLNSAQAEYNELAASGEATTGEMQAASIAAAEAAAGYDSALLGLAEAVKAGDVSVADFETTLTRWVSQGRITGEQADDVRDRLNGVTNAAKSVPDSVGMTVSASDRATRVIDSVRTAMDRIDGRVATVGVAARISGAARHIASLLAADGAIVPQYLAGGGMGGPRGTDTVPAWLTPGEMVLNDQQQAELWAMANGRGRGGGGSVTINVAGSVLTERELVRVIREELQRGGFGGLGRAA